MESDSRVRFQVLLNDAVVPPDLVRDGLRSSGGSRNA